MENKSLLKKIMIILIAFISLIILNTIFSNKAYASTEGITISKDSYDESTNELTLDIVVNKNVKEYKFVLTYEPDDIAVITYYSGEDATGLMDDFFVNDGAKVPVDLASSEYDEGRIELVSVDAQPDVVTTKSQTIFKIRFKLLLDSKILEENIPDNIIEIESAQVMDENEDYIDEDVVHIAAAGFKKVPSGITLTDVELTKKMYEVNDTIDIKEGTAVITYTNVASSQPEAATREVDLTTLKDDDGNTIAIEKIGSWVATENPQIVQMQYMSKTADINAKVHIYVTDIELSQTSETLYWSSTLGADDITATLTPQISDGTTRTAEPVSNYINTSNVDFTKAGTYNTTVNYVFEDEDADGNKSNKTITKPFTVKILDPVTEVRIDADELSKIKTNYKYNEELNLNNAKITVVRYSGPYKNVILTKDMITGYDKHELGDQTLTMHYTIEGISLNQELTVNVQDYIADLKLTKPIKTTYQQDETELDLEGAVVQTVTASGELGEEVPVTLEMISGYDENKFGAQKITVTYEGMKKDFYIIRVPQTGASGINVCTALIITLEVSLIGITTIVGIKKREIITRIKNVNKL